MRLRYLCVRKNLPLDDVAITFDHETALGRSCAVNFIVGVNGTGKSRLLQIIAEIFLELSRSNVPSYPVTLAYDLGEGTNQRTILMRSHSGDLHDASLIEYDRVLDEADWETLHERTERERQRFTGKDMPSAPTMAMYLPSVMLAYTSGAAASWESLFATRREQFQLVINAVRDNPDVEERPRGWSALKEAEYLRSEGRVEESNAMREKAAEPQARREFESGNIIFVSADDLRLAFFAVALDHAVREFREQMATEQDERRFIERINRAIAEGERMSGLRGILNTVDWLWPVTASLRLRWKPQEKSASLKEQARDEQVRKLGRASTRAVREPEPSGHRLLAFDLRRPIAEREADDRTTGAELMEIIGGESPTPFDVFNQLRVWRREGLLVDATVILRKRNIEDLLLYDWLSDGEQAFLGRMGLFHLLRGKDGLGKNDALVLLDEPETHFNDVWKREIVDIIDDSLGRSASNVVITTHSSIALTDVFNTEITLLKKRPSDGSVYVEREVRNTFGASPIEIMRDVFGASEGVGERAAQFLDLLLMAAAHPDEVEAVWEMNGNESEVRQSEPFGRLWEWIKELPHNYESDYLLYNALDAIRRFTQQSTGRAEISVVDALNALQERLGPGYYEFEFRRRLRALKERDANAS